MKTTGGRPSEALSKSLAQVGIAAIVSAAILIVMSGCVQQEAANIDDQPQPPRQGEAGNKALLIGCTKYPNFSAGGRLSHDLKGPANDVKLVRDLLITEFRFQSADIITLANADESAERQPTKANIEREMRQLANVAQPNDQIVVFFAGHGSQIPDLDSAGPNDFEPDGLDEVLLPSDVGPRDPKTNTYPNAIVDDELKQWLGNITGKGAKVWAIFDACHSGTVVRAADDEVDRRILMDELGVPEADLKRAISRLAPRGTGDLGHLTPLDEAGSNPNLVALYAGLPNEPTHDFLPPDTQDTKYYGLLTFALNRVLRSAARPLSYHELAQGIRSQYVAWGRHYPTPVIEGELADRQVLGFDKLQDRSDIILSKTDDGLTIDQGSLYGLTEETILAVHPPAGEADPKRVLGYVAIDDLGVLASGVKPVQYNKVPAELDLPTAGRCRCEPVLIDFGNRRVKIAIHAGGSRSPNALLNSELIDQLRHLAGESQSLIEIVEKASNADWILQPVGETVGIVAVDRLMKDRTADRVARFVRPELDAENGSPSTNIFDRLQGIARVQRLFEVAAARNPDSIVDVDVKMVKYKSRADHQGELVGASSPIVLEKGDIIGFELINRSNRDVNATALFVDNDYGISTLFPRGSLLDNLIPKGQSVRTGRSTVNIRTTGLEHLLVLAVESVGPPQDFSFLEQPSLALVRGSATFRGDNGMQSPLGKLLQHLQYQEGGVRGLSPLDFAQYGFSTLSWQVKHDE